MKVDNLFLALIGLTVLQAPAHAQLPKLDLGSNIEMSGRISKTNSMTCGLDCLFFVSRSFGKQFTFDELKVRVPIGESGTSMADLQRVSSEMGMELVAVQCSPENLERLTVPAIALLEPDHLTGINHFIVITKVQSDFIELFDPSVNMTGQMERSQFARSSTGYFLNKPAALYPNLLVWISVGIGLILLSRWILDYRKEKSTA
jgi:ABC-type bacteriocin/lantibiotic exporter with double-glycine peptidase domain